MQHAIVGLIVLGTLAGEAAAAADGFELGPRRRRESAPGIWEVEERKATWPGRQTAAIVVDMWDRHWCANAEKRAVAMIPRMNRVLAEVRARGGLVVHAPSGTTKFYAESPQRALARGAPRATPAPVGGDKWVYLDKKVEAELPIDDKNGGCDCEGECKPPKGGPWPWTRQHAALEVEARDAISDDGREIYNLLRARGIKHLLFVGVHTNMCVLGRPFGIRQMVRWGFDVALVRDLTDAMYDPRSAPFVAHDKGVELVIEHVEKYWASTVTSAEVLGEPRRPRIVFAIAEDEYEAKATLPAFARAELEKRIPGDYVFLHGRSKSELPGLDALEQADLLVLYLRRTTLPDADLARVRRYLDAGKPVVALRTSSHGFQNWLEFDGVVLGGKYKGHFGKSGTAVRVEPGSAKHPLLAGLAPGGFQSASWLYRVEEMGPAARPLLVGETAGQAPQAVAWTNTHRGGRVFYTSLGHPKDFELPAFRRLLLNAVLWALDRPVPRG